VSSANQAHGVPRPPNSGVNATTNSASVAQPASQHAVPKPPYAGGPIPASASSSATRNSPGYQPGRDTAPAHEASRTQQAPASSTHGEPADKSRENKSKEMPKSGSGISSANVPRPPAGYSYHAAPAYDASSVAGRASSYAANSRSYSPSASQNGSSRSTYSASAPSYHSGEGSRPAPTYSARAYTPASPQHYSAPAAPHYSGGNGGGHSSGGGRGGRSASSGGHSSGHGH